MPELSYALDLLLHLGEGAEGQGVELTDPVDEGLGELLLVVVVAVLDQLLYDVSHFADVSESVGLVQEHGQAVHEGLDHLVGLSLGLGTLASVPSPLLLLGLLVLAEFAGLQQTADEFDSLLIRHFQQEVEEVLDEVAVNLDLDRLLLQGLESLVVSLQQAYQFGDQLLVLDVVLLRMEQSLQNVNRRAVQPLQYLFDLLLVVVLLVQQPQEPDEFRQVFPGS